MKNITRNLSIFAATTAMAFAAPVYAHKVAPAPDDATTTPVAEVELDGPALWKVADEDTTIYLFGTVHALPKEVEWYKGSIADALGSSSKLITEIYMKPGTEMQAQQAFMAKGVLPAGKSLRGLLNAEDKAEYEAAMTKLELPVAAFDQFEPWFAAVNLSMLPLLKAGYSPDTGVEKILESKAGDKERGELESISFQVDLFDTLPQETQIKFLIEAAKNVDQMVPMLNSMVGEWVEGDPEGLAEMMNEGLTDPLLAEALLYARNRSWAEWIDTRLDTPGTIFIAVGAGHLAGEKSVQDALKSRGILTMRVQ